MGTLNPMQLKIQVGFEVFWAQYAGRLEIFRSTKNLKGLHAGEQKRQDEEDEK